VALTFLPEWRYHRSGVENPSYAGQRLFRHPKRGDWASVVAEMEASLRALAATAPPATS
jgi:hypothetical protein